MPRKSKKLDDRTTERGQHLINPTGEGEDPVVKAVLSNTFVNGSNVEAARIAVALQELLRGQSLMNARFAEQLDKMNKRMDEMDKASERWETDREKFINEIMDRAEKLKASGFEKDKILAKGSQEFSDAVRAAKVAQATEKIRFDQELAAMPKVQVSSPGVLVMVSENGQTVPRLMNEEVKIKHRKWVLPIARIVEVPLAVAQVLEQRRRVQAETSAREGLLSSNLEGKILDQKWKEVNSKFNSTTDALPVA